MPFKFVYKRSFQVAAPHCAAVCILPVFLWVLELTVSVFLMRKGDN